MCVEQNTKKLISAVVSIVPGLNGSVVGFLVMSLVPSSGRHIGEARPRRGGLIGYIYKIDLLGNP